MSLSWNWQAEENLWVCIVDGVKYSIRGDRNHRYTPSCVVHCFVSSTVYGYIAKNLRLVEYGNAPILSFAEAEDLCDRHCRLMVLR